MPGKSYIATADPSGISGSKALDCEAVLLAAEVGAVDVCPEVAVLCCEGHSAKTSPITASTAIPATPPSTSTLRFVACFACGMGAEGPIGVGVGAACNNGAAG